MVVGVNKKGLIQRRVQQSLDAWVAPLPYLAKQAIERTTIPKERIIEAPLGLKLSTIRNTTLSRQEARRLLLLPEDVFIAGTIGRLDPLKGQETAIKALRLLKDRGIINSLLFVGEETRTNIAGYKHVLQNLVNELDLADQVYFRPYTDEVGKALSALDIFLMTSHEETYGMVTVEAMAAGVPIIGSDSGGTPSLLGDEGIVFESQNEEHLANQWEILFRDPSLRAKVKMTAQKRVEGFSENRQIEVLHKLFSQ